MEITTFYDSGGAAVGYLDADGRSIFLQDGTAVAWVSEEGVYSYSGLHLGWLEDGWIFNRNGDRLVFTADATGGPARPPRQPRPLRSPRQARPARSAREARPAKPVRTLCWAGRDDISLWRLTHPPSLPLPESCGVAPSPEV